MTPKVPVDVVVNDLNPAVIKGCSGFAEATIEHVALITVLRLVI